MSVTESLPDLTNEKKTSAIEVGRLFFEERTRRQLSIAAISKELHIRQLYLSCIESGDLDKLPGYVYIVGFIKSYANFLNLDSDEIFRQLLLEKQDIVSSYPTPLSVPIHHQQQPSLKLLFSSLTLLIVFGFCIYIMNNVTTTESDIASILPIQDPSGPISHQRPSHSATPPSLGHPLKEQAHKEQPFQQTAIQTQASSGLSTIAGTDDNSSLSDSSVNTSSINSTKSSVTESSDNVSHSVEDKIQIIATKDAWVQILNPQGKNIFVRLMHAGESYTIPPFEKENPYILNTGNGGGVKIILNGRESTHLGEEGKVLRGISLSPEKLTKSLFPENSSFPQKEENL